MVLVGVPEHPHPSPNIGNLTFKRRAIAGSLIGGIAETQEMLDFCADKGIVSDIEMIRMQQIDEAYDRMVKGDVKYRFVIDNSRSEEHTSELQSLMRISYAVFCLKKKTRKHKQTTTKYYTNQHNNISLHNT